jgi:thioredoxin reductase (NADPH)
MTEISSKYDVVIVGGGPAGLSAAMWCAELGMNALMLEKEQRFGGQLHWIHNPIENYLGLMAANGVEIHKQFERTIESRQLERMKDTKVVKIDVAERKVDLAGGRTVSAEALILATGIRRRELGVRGERKFRGQGILESGSKERESAKGKRVAVIGGGDAAAENALMLAEHADQVYVVHRKSKLSARPEFIENVHVNPKIELVLEASVQEFGGRESLEWIDLRKGKSEEYLRLDMDGAIVRIGVEPNSYLVTDQVKCDDRGYIIVDRECRTNLERVYAIGDVANPTAPTIASAAGMGATAAKSALASLINK